MPQLESLRNSEELAVIGFDDIQMSALTHPIPNYSPPAHAIAGRSGGHIIV